MGRREGGPKVRRATPLDAQGQHEPGGAEQHGDMLPSWHKSFLLHAFLPHEWEVRERARQHDGAILRLLLEHPIVLIIERKKAPFILTPQLQGNFLVEPHPGRQQTVDDVIRLLSLSAKGVVRVVDGGSWDGDDLISLQCDDIFWGPPFPYCGRKIRGEGNRLDLARDKIIAALNKQGCLGGKGLKHLPRIQLYAKVWRVRYAHGVLRGVPNRDHVDLACP